MWEVLAPTRDMLAGDYRAAVTAAAWYGDTVTVPALDVVALTVSEVLDGRVARRTITITVDDNEGRLVPYQASDPLAPYGQLLSGGVTVQLPTAKVAGSGTR